jgi:hypothetical protein
LGKCNSGSGIQNSAPAPASEKPPELRQNSGSGNSGAQHYRGRVLLHNGLIKFTHEKCTVSTGGSGVASMLQGKLQEPYQNYCNCNSCIKYVLQQLFSTRPREKYLGFRFPDPIPRNYRP